MADAKLSEAGFSARNLKKKWVDNADGTFSEQVVTTGGGGGSASLAEQQTQTTHLSAIETAVEAIQTSSAAIQTAVQILDNVVAGNEAQVDVLTLPALPAGTNNIGDVDIASIAAGDNNIGNVDVVSLPAIPAGTNNIGDVDVITLPALPAGTNNIGDVDVLSIAAGTNTIGGTVPTASAAANGASLFRSIDLDESEEEVKATAGQVYGVLFSNTATATRFLKLYNATAANVTVGTTTPVLTLALPGNASDDVSGVIALPVGVVFDTAITAAATTGVADNDTGAPGANEVIANILFK